MNVILKFDGFCGPSNPGTLATYGFVAKTEDGEVIHRGHGLAVPYQSDDATSNVAEYSALVEALREANRHADWLVTEVQGDSQVIIYQMNGTYKVKSYRLIPLYTLARSLITSQPGIKFTWVRRTLNREADLEAYLAYTEWVGKNGKPEQRR